MRELRVDDAAPWKQRYRLPVTWADLAKANPERGLAVSNRSGVFQLYAWDVASGAMRQLTHTPTGKIGGYISPDGRYVYYLEDASGNEIGHFVRVPFEGGEPEDITPDMPPYASWTVTASRDARRLAFMTAGAEGYRFYTMPLGASGELGAPAPLHETKTLTRGVLFSANGQLAVVSSSERSGRPEFSLLAFDVSGGERIGELWDGEGSSVQAEQFSPLAGDSRVLASSDRSGVNRPLLWDARSGERFDLQLGEIAGEIYPQDWSPDGARILLTQLHNAVHRLFVYDLASNTLTRLDHPAGTLNGAFFAPNGEIFAHWEDATHELQLIALDGETGAKKRVVLSAGVETPPGRPWRSVSFPSSDGQIIQGWVATPEGEGPFPTILETHGGPTAATTEHFSAGAQCWLDHGFAFASINYRGSTTFGKDFERQIWGDLGHWEVEDMVAARDYLVREGIARPDEILLTGWSYGGYLTLMGLGKRPELWAGGMAGIAIADWSIQYEDTADTLKGYQVALFGGTPQEKPEQYAASSPITYAERVQAPVLVIQGSNDTRCPPRPLRMYEEKLRALGKDIEVEWFEAGHGSYVVEQSIAHQERMLRFAYRVLG
jgi:dipeptidyl aminopeptidase/acylaminoacyl peptidase